MTLNDTTGSQQDFDINCQYLVLKQRKTFRRFFGSNVSSALVAKFSTEIRAKVHPKKKIFQLAPHFPGVHQRSVSISSKSIGVGSGSPVSGAGSEILAAGSIAWAGLLNSAAAGSPFPLIAAAVCSRMCCTV
jgi:hypothetical protein